MLAGSRDQILLFQNLFAFARKKSQGAYQLPSALLELLGKAGGTTGGAIEVRLKAIIHAKQQIHGADRLAGGDHVLHPSHLLQVESSGTRGEDTPVHGIGEGLLGGEGEICCRGKQRRKRLPDGDQHRADTGHDRDKSWIPYHRPLSPGNQWRSHSVATSTA